MDLNSNTNQTIFLFSERYIINHLHINSVNKSFFSDWPRSYLNCGKIVCVWFGMAIHVRSNNIYPRRYVLRKFNVRNFISTVKTNFFWRIMKNISQLTTYFYTCTLTRWMIQVLNIVTGDTRSNYAAVRRRGTIFFTIVRKLVRM